MAKYLALVKYSREGSAAVAKDGLSSRRTAIQTAMDDQGARIVDFWAVDSFDWHVAFVAELPDDQTTATRAATNVVNYGLGHLENFIFLPLASVDAADAAMQALTAVRPPGQ